MSTRIILNNNAMALPNLSRNHNNFDAIRTSDLRRVKRALFDPIDHESSQNFVQDELIKVRTDMSEKWNFNFQLEETLNTNGTYIWRPVTPPKMIRPVKRRPSSEFDDIAELYGNPIIRPVRPIPIKLEPIPIKLEPATPMHQSLITDFMAAVKRQRSSDVTKKLDCNCMEARPAKIPKMINDFS